MKRSDYIEMRKQLAQDYHDKLAALDKVFEMFGGTPIAEKSAVQSSSNANGSVWIHDISKRDAVRETVKAMQRAPFTLKDVKTALATQYPNVAPEIADNQLSAILSKLGEKGELTIVRKKVGKAPAQYVLPGVLTESVQQ
jgi:hypothetical protein